MQYLTLKGRKKAVPAEKAQKCRMDWEKKSLSNFQFDVKRFLKPFWHNNVCYEEFPVVGTRMHIDIYNATKKIAIECDGQQHVRYNKHFHRGSASVYFGQVSRDNSKEEWCELNGITLVRVYETDVKNLSREWFREQGVEL